MTNQITKQVPDTNLKTPKNGNTGTPESKRYNLILPTPLFNQIKQVSEKNGTTIAGTLKRFISLGLMFAELDDNQNVELIIREGNQEKTIKLIW